MCYGTMNETLENELNAALGIMEIQCLSDYLIGHPEKIASLYHGLSECSVRYLKNAGWVLMHIAKKAPAVLTPSRDLCYDAAMRYRDERILRNLLFVANVLLGLSEKEEVLSHLPLFDVCLELVASRDFAPGTRANAFSVVVCFCRWEPDLVQEVEALLELVMEEASVGLKNRCVRLVKSLENR